MVRHLRRVLVALAVTCAVTLATGIPSATFAAPGGDDRLLTIVSLGEGGVSSDGDSMYPAFDQSGRYVAFQSAATNLVPGDTNGTHDVFVRDRRLGTIERVSVRTGGAEGIGYSNIPKLSADGRFVMFSSEAALVGSDTNGVSDVYVHDRQTGVTEIVSAPSTGTVASSGSWGTDMSADGRYVVFWTDSGDFSVNDTNGLVDVYVRDRQSSSTWRASTATGGSEVAGGSGSGVISDDGRYVAFVCNSDDMHPLDGNGAIDVFLKDLLGGGETRLVSITSTGSQSTADSYSPLISADGSKVGWVSRGAGFVPFDTNGGFDIFVRDIQAGTTTCMSVGPTGSTGNDVSAGPSWSDDFRYVAFHSRASDLVSGDDTGTMSIFMRDTLTGVLTCVSEPPTSSTYPIPVANPVLSGNGMALGIWAFEDGWVPGDANGFVDILVAALERQVLEIAGSDRFRTAAACSREGFPLGADAVVLATGSDWPDALGGAALAGVLDAPLLLTAADAIPVATAFELGRLQATEVYILGGTGVVSAAVEKALDDYLGADNVHRLAGSDRYATARAVADEVIAIEGGGYDGRAFVATGGGFADALAASPIAAAKGWPTLLAPAGGNPSLPPEVTGAIVLGGTGVVAESTEAWLAGQLGASEVMRVAGADRYSTAAAVAAFGVAEGLYWDHSGVAVGTDFPDGLAGGPRLARRHAVLLLTPGDTLCASARDALRDSAGDIAYVKLLGGPGVLTQPVRDAVEAALE